MPPRRQWRPPPGRCRPAARACAGRCRRCRRPRSRRRSRRRRSRRVVGEVAAGDRVRSIDILRIGQRGGARGEQRRTARGQRRTASQRHLWFLGHTHVQRRRRIQRRLDQRDVDSRTDHIDAVRLGRHRLGARDQPLQLGDRGVVVGGQLLAKHVAQRAVSGVHHRQGRGVGLDEQHAGAAVAHGTPTA